MDFSNLIFSIAYNMTGDYETTRDVVQDINLKFLENPISETVTDKRNYVIRTTINHCLNLKKKENRMKYVGIWLPEPISTDREKTIHHSEFEERDLLCYELAYLMEQLSPTERAIFVLREAFDFDHTEIAEAINISSANSRQLFKRAKEKVANLRHGSITNPVSIDVAKKFVDHIGQGNTKELIALLNDDIQVVGDGGGKAPAALIPVSGRELIANSYLKLFDNKNYSTTFEFTQILSQPAIIFYINGEIKSVQILSIAKGKISRIFSVTNPDKIFHFKKII